MTKAALFGACIAPFVLVVLKAFGLAGVSLGPNPVAELIDTMGKTALNILLITLAVSPLRRLTRWNVLVIYRRMLGLFSAFYLGMHFTAYAVLDLRLAWSTILVDVTQRPYTVVGMLALLLMIPLVVTSTRGFQRRLRRNWTRLHQIVYAVAILAVTHYLWQTKLDMLEPLVYAAILTVLLGERLVRRLVRMSRQAAEKGGPAAAYRP
ncbi:MAG: protein-methionine-sulfoxide reductase heme-binding subunit MsrQ [Gammaproteobacteria bacterium]